MYWYRLQVKWDYSNKLFWNFVEISWNYYWILLKSVKIYPLSSELPETKNLCWITAISSGSTIRKGHTDSKVISWSHFYSFIVKKVG
jgi:hypothetical protein